MSGLQDSYGREIDYLRVSVTDRCNLRCIYCMPAEGIRMTTHTQVLSYDEIVRVCTIMAGLGIKKIKLTGGEPLARKNVPELVREVKRIPGIEQVTLTTNGVALASCMDELAAAGLDGMNISLDTTDRELFREITRKDELASVLRGLQAALSYPQIPVKLNCVPLGRKEQNLLELAAFARDYPIHVRFIEMMPVGYGKEFSFTGEEEIKAELEAVYGPMTPYQGVLGNGPCHYYELEGFKGKIGFISAISHKFCDRCNRVRLTSQGFLKTCLQYDTGKDLRTLLRNGSGDEEIARVIIQALEGKPGGHHFLEKDIREENSMCMSQIGG